MALINLEGNEFEIKISYKVLKQFEAKTKKTVTNLNTVGMEDLVYLIYLGLKNGSKDSDTKFEYSFTEFEDLIDNDMSILQTINQAVDDNFLAM